MPVYVDNMEAKFGRMIMCHLLADTHEELIEIADKIRVQRKWIQYPHTYKEHFDIALSKRKLAIQHGAKEITMIEAGQKTNEMKANWPRCVDCNRLQFGPNRTTHCPDGLGCKEHGVGTS